MHRNAKTLTVLGGVVVGMVGLAYASVPLYDLFCRVTGYGGTTQVAEAAPDTLGERVFTVQFDGSVNRDLKWTFKPVMRRENIQSGQTSLAYYEATNISDKPLVGTATFNVSPDKAGLYFNKIDCFCFTEQVLAPGETVQMPVSYFIDPEIEQDDNLDDVTRITLSYTFFKAPDQSAVSKPEEISLVRDGSAVSDQ